MKWERIRKAFVIFTAIVVFARMGFTIVQNRESIRIKYFPERGELAELVDDEARYAPLLALDIKRINFDEKEFTDADVIEKITSELLEVEVEEIDTEEYGIFVSEKCIRFYTNDPHNVPRYSLYIDEKNEEYITIIAYYTAKGEGRHGYIYKDFKVLDGVSIEAIFGE